jgi:hypothetical protein
MTDAEEIGTLRRLLAAQQEATQRAIARAELVVKQRDQIGDLSNEHFEKMIAERRRAEKAEEDRDASLDESRRNYKSACDLHLERDSLREALRVAREALANFETRGPDADNLVWLIFHGKGTSGGGMVNLGEPKRIVTQVVLHLDADRRAAISRIDELTGGDGE